MSEAATLDIAAPADRRSLPVTNPFTGEVVGHVPLQGPDCVEPVLERARQGARIAGSLSRHRRAEILDTAAQLVLGRQEQFARLIVSEAGKTIRQARKETLRAVNTLKLSAAEARRNAGEVIPFDSYEGSENRHGWFTREPLGIIAAITPYNDPLNLVAHKLGPAIAGGNSIILKPSQLTPLSAQWLVDTLLEAGLPAEVITSINGGRDLAQAVVSARDVRMISFTGGFATGEAISRTAGLKRLAMDLGGNAPVIVFDDADLTAAVGACVSGAFWAAGQNCIGTQRILIQRSVYAEFRRQFLVATSRLVCGDPMDERTDVGPMITPASAQNVQQKTDDALAAGATLLCGNTLSGNLYAPTVLEGVPENCDLWAEEAFAPVVTLQAFDTDDEALELANRVDFSLHAGVFTSKLGRAMNASRILEAGGVMINDSSDYRFDGMPFGGFKYGSMGREGIRFAFEDMTQPKVVCIND
ncbi:aldehyde dehydrogenase family protein [Pseudarthrobacter sp. P1]|uniref:aldehyde dehydrogenase family protein n=1 Tax=Pseudarthrobacter sp. P1 TaxID=3418418 RepID=UPI003CF2291C